MMPDNIDQNLCRGADSLPLFHCFIDQRLSFCVQLVRLFDDRLCPIEKIDQRLARRQRFVNLPKLCIAETGNVTNEVNEPVLQHSPPCCWLYRWPITLPAQPAPIRQPRPSARAEPSTTVRCLRRRIQVLAFPYKPQECSWVHVVAGMVDMKKDSSDMKKAGLALATAATIGVTALVAPSPAQAWRGGLGPGLAGGLIAGAVIGGIASSAYAYGPGYGYYGGTGYGGYGGYTPPSFCGGVSPPFFGGFPRPLCGGGVRHSVV